MQSITPGRLRDGIAGPPGGGFAFVMATGIVSLAAAVRHLSWMAVALFAINLVAFPALSIWLAWRAIRYPAAIAAELTRHRGAPAFLTLVAAIAVLGDQVALLTDQPAIVAGLWLTGCILFLILGYAILLLLTIQPDKPPPREGLDGGWLLLVVAPQALAVLGTHAAAAFAHPNVAIDSSLALFLLGVFLYPCLIVLILNRWLLEPLSARDMVPSYWINMGAMAITALAGSRLLTLAGGDNALLAMSRPALVFTTLLFWAGATWWIPLLTVLTLWRHTFGRVKLEYEFAWWSLVFPLGMYTAATGACARVAGLPWLIWIPRGFVWVALIAWFACCTGMIRRTSRRYRAAFAPRRSLFHQ